MNTPVFDLSLIKPMFLKAISNMEAVKVFINYTLGMLLGFVGCVIFIFIILSIAYFIYLLLKNKDKGKTKKIIVKESLLECRKKFKIPLWKCRHIFIGGILIAIARILVSFIFYLYGGLSGYECTFSPEENRILGIWATLSLIIFLVAPVFIMFCFGNKFIRNIGILIYIFGIFFIAVGKLISISCAGIHYEDSEKVESIENLEKMEDINKIGGLKNGNWDNYNYIIPDNAEILVEHKKIIEGEAVNLSITIIKNGKKMDNYDGTVYFSIVDKDGIPLKSSEYTLPNKGIYTFVNNDGGYKEFQKGLTINKEGTFYIEVQDLMDSIENILGRQKITVIKTS